MAARAPSVKRYVVRLSAEEGRELDAIIRKGKGPAARLLRAFLRPEHGISHALCGAAVKPDRRSLPEAARSGLDGGKAGLDPVR